MVIGELLLVATGIPPGFLFWVTLLVTLCGVMTTVAGVYGFRAFRTPADDAKRKSNLMERALYLCVLVVPLAVGDLAAQDGSAEPLVAWDDLGAGEGQLVALSEGGEAAQPFRPAEKPVDAYVAALIDRLQIAGEPS